MKAKLQSLRAKLAAIPMPSGMMERVFRENLDKRADTLVAAWDEPPTKQAEILAEMRPQLAAASRMAGGSKLSHLISTVDGDAGNSGTLSDAERILEEMSAVFPD